jgi:hypothetical protein
MTIEDYEKILNEISNNKGICKITFNDNYEMEIKEININDIDN